MPTEAEAIGISVKLKPLRFPGKTYNEFFYQYFGQYSLSGCISTNLLAGPLQNQALDLYYPYY